ncbi:glycosyl transferase family 1 [Ammoniphilus oxalaticus]|uniref:Glycosyl transferase family 1 n=1 Tax=Ammoniphilus oxalaticus TaxID=66863 RepID=A0A419SIF7_9BACL|nr:glycosyltransferase family 4 protein [Ammoniphilus oxalaticus]RKD23824.1 glycosyl transferase family 1 [Ammoniphilus oxalaticus]
MNQSKKVLIIAYLFPPIGGGGVQRALKMAKYLNQYGWQVHVLTVEPIYHVSLDESLLNQLPETVIIHRTQEFSFGAPPAVAVSADSSETDNSNQKKNVKSAVKAALFPTLKKMKKYALIPDDQILWFPSATKKGLEIIREHQIDAIFSTSGPYTNHLVGLRLKKKTRLPWIVDFRDPWTQNMHRPGVAWREKVEEKMERNVLREADILLTVTRSFANDFQRKFGNVIKRTEVIHNGFDPEDYQQLATIASDRQRCSFIYTGIFYQERNPRLFLQAIHELLAEGKLKRDLIELKFAGVFDYPGYTENMDCAQALGLEDIVKVLGHLPHQEALIELKSSDVLLLIADTAPGSGRYIPGKLFEYMAIGKPILALSLPGESTAIIEQYGLGQVVNPTSKEEIKAGIMILYEQWLNQDGTERSTVIEPSTSMYQRKTQAGMLAKLLDQITT